MSSEGEHLPPAPPQAPPGVEGPAGPPGLRGLASVLGQPAAMEALNRMVAGGRIPSALLFFGPRHVGKRTAALALAQALNCPAEPGRGCGRCPPCRKIAEGTHPDVEVVSPDGQFIRIDQVRELGARLGLIPFEAKKRVQVIAQAERMNPPAANAFLKTLEEPPADTLIVLCAESAARLPETIASRCLPLRFGFLPEPVLRTLLGATAGEAPRAAAFGARLAQGRVLPGLPQKAPHWMELRKEAFEALEAITGQQEGGFPAVSEAIGRWCGSEDWKFVLQWLETLFRDLALLGSGVAGGRAINADCPDELGSLLRRFAPPGAEACHRRVLAAREALEINANRVLTLEALWLGFKEIANPAGAPP